MARVLNKNLFRASYRYELVSVVLCALIIFIGASLLSYNPHDRSWWFYSSEQLPISNWCGAAGAQIAAFLLYVLGSASFGIVILLGYIFTLHIKRRAVRGEWDRVAACVSLIICTDTLFAMHQIDFWASPFPGGLIGSACCKLLVRWFDAFGTAVFLSAVLTISFIVATRFSFVGGIQRMLMFVRVLVDHPALAACYAAVCKLVRGLSRLGKRLWSTIQGYVTRTTVPAQETDAPAYELDTHGQFDVAMDAFWQGLQQQEKH